MLELLAADKKNTVEKTVKILRDRAGMENTDIGMGNEKAVNQMIAHHSIIFEPQKKRVWVSTGPWHLGEFVCLRSGKGIFDERNENEQGNHGQFAESAGG